MKVVNVQTHAAAIDMKMKREQRPFEEQRKCQADTRFALTL